MQPKIVLHLIAIILILDIVEVLQLYIRVAGDLSENWLGVEVKYFSRVGEVEEREVAPGDGLRSAGYVCPEVLGFWGHYDTCLGLLFQGPVDEDWEADGDSQEYHRAAD